MAHLLTRRSVLTGLGFSTIIGGAAGLIFSPTFRDLVLGTGEHLSYQSHRLIGRNALAPEFSEADMSPDLRTNGNTMPASPDYRRQIESNFANWQLTVDGLVTAPRAFSLAALKAMRARTQITRRDCVEGWSANSKWSGVPMASLLAQVPPLPGVCQRSCPLISCGVSDFRGADFVFGVEPDGSGGLPVAGFA